MHIDRLRWLVKEGKHLTLDGAVEIAKAAPELLREMGGVGASMEEGAKRRQLSLRLALTSHNSHAPPSSASNLPTTALTNRF